jgi:hypothetical protein
MANIFESVMTGALGEATAAIHGYKAMKQKAWGVGLDKELVDLRKDEGYIQNAADNVAFVKQQKEFSDPNSLLMIDYLFKNSPALFSTKEPRKAVDRTKGAFDSFPGISFDKDTGIYSIDFDIEGDTTGLARGELATSEQTVENFQLKNREESRKHLINSGIPKHLTTLFLGQEVEEQKPEDIKIPEGTLTVSGYLKQANAEWHYNTYLPDSLKWDEDEFLSSKFFEYNNILSTVQEEAVKAGYTQPIMNAKDVIQFKNDPTFWVKKGFNDIIFQNITKRHGIDIPAMASIYKEFKIDHSHLFSSMSLASESFSDSAKLFEDLTKQFGIHSKEAAEAYQKMLIDKQNLKRINNELTTTWSMYSGAVFGTSISPYTGFAGQIGYKNLDTAFRHASLELKEKAGLEINYKDLLYNFDERNKEATIHTMKNGVKFVTYTSPQVEGYTFIVLEDGMVLKVANDKLE